jgi:hypothetical protein
MMPRNRNYKIRYASIAAALAVNKPHFVSTGSYTAAMEMQEQWKRIVLSVADVLAADSDAFNRARFLTAAGVDLQQKAAA